MPVFTLRSKRHQPAKKNPDVYQYDTLPQEFRIQVVHILGSTLGEYVGNAFGRLSEPIANLRWRALFSQYTRAKGMLYLGKDPKSNVYTQCTEYLLRASVEDALDFIDYAFHFTDQDLRQDITYYETHTWSRWFFLST